MSDYQLTKRIDKTTHELPDKITLKLPSGYAWVVIKQMIIQLELCQQEIEIEVYGTLRKVL